MSEQQAQGRLTPEKRSGLPLSLPLQINPNGTDCFDSRRAGGVAREHHIKVCQIAIAQALVEVCNLLCSCTSTLELPVPRMVA